jgi:hypothetical protein
MLPARDLGGQNHAAFSITMTALLGETNNEMFQKSVSETTVLKPATASGLNLGKYNHIYDLHMHYSRQYVHVNCST